MPNRVRESTGIDNEMEETAIRSDVGYVTGTSSPGVTFAATLSSGSGLNWSGAFWSQSSLSFDKIKLAPGDYNGDGVANLGYLTPNSASGVGITFAGSTRLSVFGVL